MEYVKDSIKQSIKQQFHSIYLFLLILTFNFVIAKNWLYLFSLVMAFCWDSLIWLLLVLLVFCDTSMQQLLVLCQLILLNRPLRNKYKCPYVVHIYTYFVLRRIVYMSAILKKETTEIYFLLKFFFPKRKGYMYSKIFPIDFIKFHDIGSFTNSSSNSTTSRSIDLNVVVKPIATKKLYCCCYYLHCCIK